MSEGSDGLGWKGGRCNGPGWLESPCSEEAKGEGATYQQSDSGAYQLEHVGEGKEVEELKVGLDGNRGGDE